jgi:arylsulfatase A-like enzyme
VEPYVLSHDVPATVLDVLGIESPEPMQGRSAMPLVRRTTADLHGDTIITAWVERANVRDREWSYVIDTVTPDAEPLLFHTAADPVESRNVAADHPDIVRDRRHRLEEFLGGSLPYTYRHQPDYRNLMNLQRHLEIRQRLGMTL